MKLRSSLLVALIALWAIALQAENWPRFRGPTGQGISSEKNLPLQWSATSNVVWKTPIPGAGWSSPILWNNRLFLTAATDEGRSCRILCLDRGTGKILWNTEVFTQELSRKEGKNSFATPTPATDGQRVYAVFGDGSFAAVDFNGSLVWTNREVKFYSRHGLGASPILFEDLLIMPFDGSNRVPKAGDYPNNPPEERLGWQIPWDQAFLVALNTKTGARVWTGKRGLSRIAHVTPNLLQQGDRTELISAAGDAIQGFDPRTGERLWTVYSQGEGVAPSFAMGGGMIFASSGFEKSTIRAVKTGGRGDVTATHVLWEQRKGVPTQSSLLYAAPYLFSVTDGGIVNCYDAKSGDLIWQERIGGKHCASPVLADERIYFLSEEGETVVIAPGPEFKLLAKNSINEYCQASIAVSDHKLFIRSDKHVFCIGMKMAVAP
jgi:outer membrane protein assembly factor BamB